MFLLTEAKQPFVISGFWPIDHYACCFVILCFLIHQFVIGMLFPLGLDFFKLFDHCKCEKQRVYLLVSSIDAFPSVEISDLMDAEDIKFELKLSVHSIHR